MKTPKHPFCAADADRPLCTAGVGLVPSGLPRSWSLPATFWGHQRAEQQQAQAQPQAQPQAAVPAHLTEAPTSQPAGPGRLQQHPHGFEQQLQSAEEQWERAREDDRAVWERRRAAQRQERLLQVAQEQREWEHKRAVEQQRWEQQRELQQVLWEQWRERERSSHSARQADQAQHAQRKLKRKRQNLAAEEEGSEQPPTAASCSGTTGVAAAPAPGWLPFGTALSPLADAATATDQETTGPQIALGSHGIWHGMTEAPGGQRASENTAGSTVEEAAEAWFQLPAVGAERELWQDQLTPLQQAPTLEALHSPPALALPPLQPQHSPGGVQKVDELRCEQQQWVQAAQLALSQSLGQPCRERHGPAAERAQRPVEEGQAWELVRTAQPRLAPAPAAPHAHALQKQEQHAHEDGEWWLTSLLH